jgi:glycosyltransferase involved in cell wall biosynthesis
VRVALDWRPAVRGRGGIPVYVRSLAAALRARFPDDRLSLYAAGLRARRPRKRAPPPPSAPASARVVSWPLPTLVVEGLSRLGAGPDRLVGGCDVFHLTDFAWLGRTRAPLVVTVHDVLFDEMPAVHVRAARRGLRHVTRLFVRHAARLVVPSVRTKIGLVERFGADPDRVDVVPLAPRALPAALPEVRERPYVLAVGTQEPRKNLHRLLAAHALARERGSPCDLVVAGARGWLDADLAAAFARTPGAVRAGEVTDERLSALYRGALAAAYPSLGEGFGLPVAEAMSMGVPLLTSAGTACADLAGESALLVDPYDVEAIADGLLRLGTDAALRADLAARGRARVAGLTWEATAAGTREAYARAAA